MISGTYLIAGLRVGVTSMHRDVHELYRGYETDLAPELLIRTGQADIEYEKKQSLRLDELTGRRHIPFNEGYLETLAVYRKLAEQAPGRGVILFHGSALAVDGAAYLFAAPSGTGKSTHARLWRELLGERAVMVNDDKPLISVTAEGVTVHGSPYNGKHMLGANISVPLKAICVLQRAGENAIVPAEKGEVYVALLQQLYRPSDPAALAAALSLFDEMAGRVRLYRLFCNMDVSAAELAYNTMKG